MAVEPLASSFRTIVGIRSGSSRSQETHVVAAQREGSRGGSSVKKDDWWSSTKVLKPFGSGL